MPHVPRSFNMKEELDEGRFTADGTYTANAKDPLEDHDVWLSGLSKRSIREAREAKERMDAKQREREAEEARSEEQLTQLRDDCMIGLLGLVRPGETPAKALTRLGKAKKRADELAASKEPKTAAAAAASKGKGKGKADGDNDAMDLDEGDPAAASAASTGSSALTPSQRYNKKIDRLTHYASTLLSSHGELEIYDQSYEDIIKTLKAEGAVRRDWVPPTDPDLALEEQEERAHAKAQAEADAAASAAENGKSGGRSRVVIARPTASSTAASTAPSTQYFYKWRSPPPGQPADQEYGPYDRATLEGWIAGGYFGGPEADRIFVRTDGGAQSYRSWQEVQ